MKFRDLHINIRVRLLGSFFNRCAYSSILPFMALYISEIKGAKFAGFFLSLMIIIQLFSSFLGGYIVDIFPRRKLLIFTSFSESLSVLFMFINIQSYKFNLFLLSYILYVTFSTFRSPALNAIVQDSANKDNKKIIYRIQYFLLNLSIAIGAFLGGFFYSFHKEFLFLLFTLTSFTLSILYSIYIEDNKKFIRKNKRKNILIIDFLSSYLSVFKNIRYILVVLGSSLLISFEYMTSSYLSVRLKNNFHTIHTEYFDINGVHMYSLLMITNTVIIVIFSLSINKYLEKFNDKKVILIGLVLYSFGYCLLFSNNIFISLFISITIATIGEIIYAPLKNSEQLELIPQNEKGTYSTINNLGLSLGNIIANIFLSFALSLNYILITVIILIISLIGSFFMYTGLFSKKIRK